MAKAKAVQPDYDPYTPRVPGDGEAAPEAPTNTNVTPAEDAVIALNLGKLQRATDVFQTANGVFRNVVKHVDGKLHLKAAKRAIAIVKSDQRDEIIEELRALFEYLAILGIPVDKNQLDLFRVEQPRTPAVDKAAEHGRYVGIMGGGTDANPYALDSAQGQAWMAAWHGGGEERQRILAMEPEDGSELLKGAEGIDADDDADSAEADPFQAAAE